MMTRHSYEFDGVFDWILKKEGRQTEVKTMISQMDTKAPLPRTASQPRAHH